MTQNTQDRAPQQKMFSADDIASMCGICRASIYNMVKRGELPPPKKFGRSSRWPIESFAHRITLEGETSRG